jgi:hypothetical protein
MFAYFWKTHTATISGETTRRERCEACANLFQYTISRTVSGSAHNSFGVFGAFARQNAEQRARDHLQRRLATAVEPVHCPRCGIYQTPMVQVLRRRLGSRYNPNKYARDRITVTARDAWQAACSANTVSAYTNFLETWPAYREAAQDRIRALKHPRLKKWMTRLGWFAWGAIALIFAVAAVLSSVRW